MNLEHEVGSHLRRRPLQLVDGFPYAGCNLLEHGSGRPLHGEFVSAALLVGPGKNETG